MSLEKLLELVDRNSVVQILDNDKILMYGINSSIPFEFIVAYGLSQVKTISTNKSDIVIIIE